MLIQSLRSNCDQIKFFQFKIWRVVKLLSHNLTRCISLYRNLASQKRYIRKLTRCKTFNRKSDEFFLRIPLVVLFPVQKLTCGNFLNQNRSFWKSTKKEKYVVFTEKKNKTWVFVWKLFWHPTYRRFFNFKILCVVLFQIKNWHLLEVLIQNLTRCTVFTSKSDKTKISPFKIWHVVKLSSQNLTRQKIFNSRADLLLFKNARKKTNHLVFTEKKNKTWFFECKPFWKPTFRKILNANSDALYFFSIQNLT